MKEQMKEEQNELKNPKKIRWNISMAMSYVFETLWKSKLKLKKTKKYETSMQRLKDLYKLTQTQIWILSLVCEHSVECDDSTSISNIAEALNVPAMALMKWKNDMEILKEKGFFQANSFNGEYYPSGDFCDSVSNNTEFITPPKAKLNDIDFINQFGEKYDACYRENLSYFRNRRILTKFEYQNKKLNIVERVSKEVPCKETRFFLYDVTYDVISKGEACLNETLGVIFDNEEHYKIAQQMMEETHELFSKDLVEFGKRGNLSDATVTLTSKGKKLVLGDKAFLFEDRIDDKNLIKTDSIKSKTLFYSQQNQKEIDRLKNALQEEKLKGIQKRLQDDGLPIGVAVLLYGAPGTGKTESVMQIAKETGRSIVHVDIAEAKSAWFGESEKRIKKIFTSYKNACEIAKKKGELMPILLFNEADALISKRKEVTSGNCAQTENAMQNIILEELENLQGIFIATTNLATNMDTAFERRFLFKIKFENPSTEAKTSIWMNKLSWLNKDQATQFAKDYDFSGGQIDNIVRKVAMNEVITGERPGISEINDMCKTEKIENPDGAKRMGFCL